MKMKPPPIGREPSRLSFGEPGVHLDKDRLDGRLAPDLRERTIPISRVHESLIEAKAGIERRLEKLEDDRRRFDQERRTTIRTLSEAWVPDLSAATTGRLAQYLPQTVSNAALRESLDTRKFLGMFETERYTRALAHARMAVVAALDQGQAGDGFPEGKQIAKLGRQIETADGDLRMLQQRWSEVDQIRLRMEQAMNKGLTEIPETALPHAASDDTAGGRAKPSTRAAYQAPRPNTGRSPLSSPASSSMGFGGHDDMTDFWIYYLTDVPVSGRTLLWSALDHHHLDSVGSGAAMTAPPPPWAPDPTPAPAPASVPDFDFSSSRALGDTPLPADPSPLLPDPAAGNGPSLGDGQAPWSVPDYGADPSLPSFDDRSASQADTFGSYS